MIDVKADLAKYELFYNRLLSILEEGKETLRYLSGSYITREVGEVVMGFYLPDGECAAMAAGILIHILNVTGVIRYMNDKRFAEDIGIYDGDMFLNNDPYIGGMHTPDCALVAPFFYKGVHLGYIAAIAHTTEMGAIDPGSMSPRATESYHDGFHIPPIKLIERGKLRRDIYDLWLRAVRDPRTIELDTRAKIAGNETARRRLTEMAEDFGVDFFKAACQELIKDSELLGQAKLKKFKTGAYRTRIYTDTCGGTVGDKLSIVTVEIEFMEQGKAVIRTPVVSPQVKGFNNCYYAAMTSLLFCVLLQDIFYDVRWNTGTSHNIRLEIPPHSRLNADIECSVGYCPVGIGYTFQSAFCEALARAYYVSGMKEEVHAVSNMSNQGIWAGRDQLGRTYGNVISSHGLGGGDGARVGKDGINGPVANYNPIQYHPDTEGNEMIVPLLQLVVARNPNSGGFGRWRGGTHNWAIDIDHKSTFSVNLNLGSNSKINANQGMFGGYSSGVGFTSRMVNTDFYEKAKAGKPIPYTVDELTKYLGGEYIPGPAAIPVRESKHGDMLIHAAVGGPGLGDPIERDPEAIVSDIRNKEVTLGVAEKVYSVAIDPKTLEIDYEKTKSLRGEKKKQRLSQGIPAQELIKKMVMKRKNRDLPQVVLTYLDETSNFCSLFREELDFEERLLERKLEPLRETKAKQLVGELTLYVNIIENENGDKVAVCSKCGFAYCDASENFKLYCLVYERSPEEIHPGILCPNKEWTVYREFYCPGCGTQVEVETTPPGTPIFNNYKLKL